GPADPLSAARSAAPVASRDSRRKLTALMSAPTPAASDARGPPHRPAAAVTATPRIRLARSILWRGAGIFFLDHLLVLAGDPDQPLDRRYGPARDQEPGAAGRGSEFG